MKKQIAHFYYSEEQAFIQAHLDNKDFYDGKRRTHFNTFIDENGKEKIYTELKMVDEGEKPKSNDDFFDFQYLGTGTIHTVNGIKQNINNNIEITETVQDASYSHFAQNFYKKMLFEKLEESSRDIELPDIDIDIDLEPKIKHNNIDVESNPKLEAMVVSQLLQKKSNNSQSKENQSVDVNFQLLQDFEMPQSLKDAHTKEYDKDILKTSKNRKLK